MTEPVHPFEKANLGKAPFRCIGYEELIHQACQGAPIQCGGSCDYCGTGIMHSFKIRGADGRTFKVGCDCVLKTDLRLHAEVKAVRKAARLEAIATERAKRRTEGAAKLFESYPGLREALTCEHPIVASIAAKFAKDGWLSSRQAALVVKLAEEQAIRNALVFCAEPPAVHAPSPTGRVTLAGRVLCVKSVESLYGTTLKMLVSVRTHDGAWKAWSTVPAGLGRVERGQIVELAARVEVSKDDPTFAFLSRPTVPRVKAPRLRVRKAA